MKKDPNIFLEHIFESICSIEEYVEGFSREEFIKDAKTQDAVMLRFEIIGEAAKNIPKIFLKKQSHVVWHELVSMRNMLIHEYFGVDMHIVWDTIKKDIPRLKIDVREILNKTK